MTKFVSVDRVNLLFLHVHHEHEVVSALAYLEACDRSTIVAGTANENFLVCLNAFELRNLYRNTTGTDITGTDERVVREMLATLVTSHLRPTLALLPEVESQVNLVIDDLERGKPWKYQIGSAKPAPLENLLTLHCKPLPLDVAATCAARAPQHRAPRAAARVRPVLQAAPAGPTAPKARMSSVRPTIWAHADRVWEEAGKPTDKNVVLELRKRMMAELESEKGIKRTSSSNELGNWMKDRLA